MGLDLRVLRMVAHMAIEAGGGGFIPGGNFMLPRGHWLTKVEHADPDLVRLYMGGVN